MQDAPTNKETTPFRINDALAMPRQCGWCGMIHGPRCPSVKAMEFHPDGTVKRVEFFAPNDFPPLQIFPGGAFPIPTCSGHAP